MLSGTSMQVDIWSGDIGGLTSLCTCTLLVQLEAGVLLVLGVAPLPSVGLALLDKADLLEHVAARVHVDSPATKVSWPMSGLQS